MTTFKILVNNLRTALAANYTAGSGTMTVAAGTGALFGNVSASAPVRFTVITAATYATSSEVLAIYQATGVNGDILSGVSPVEGTTDRNYSAGDKLEARPTQGSYADIHAAINAIENASYAVDTAVVHLAGCETITGVKAFSTPPTVGNLTGLLKASAGQVTTAAPGTDYVVPSGSITGTAGNVSGTVAIANGGTGQTTKSDAFNALSPIATIGDLIYGSGTNTAARLAGNTSPTKKLLTQSGTGLVSGAPSWDSITPTDLPAAVLLSSQCYANPPWLTSVPGAVVAGNIPGNAAGITGQIASSQISDLNSWAGSTSITTLGTIAGKLTLGAISDPVNPGAGDVWNSVNQKVLSFTSSGLATRAGGIIWQGLGPGTPVANTTSQLSILSGIANTQGSLTIPANSLAIGKYITIDAFGQYSSTASAPTFKFVFLLGGVVIATTSAVTVPIANTNSMWHFHCPAVFQIQAIGTSGKIIGKAVVVGLGSTTNIAGYATQPGPPGIGQATIDTTNPLIFDLQVKWSAASASNSFQFLGGALSMNG